MTQQHPTPSSTASGTRPEALQQPPGARDGTGRTLRLQPGQDHLVWLDAGSELRCLSGTVVLNSAPMYHPGAIIPPHLQPHAAWRSAQSTWVGVRAGASSPAALLLTLPEMLQQGCAHGTSHPQHPLVQRLRDGLRRLFAGEAHSAG